MAKIIVQAGRCSGHARCAAVAPEIFTLDESGYIAFTERLVPEGAEDRAARGVRSCPERALKLIREEATNPPQGK